ncbi:MAG: PilW family protein, partial [Moraxellaceae bacterium]|nr:PilW family protein [Moraxellaceae bacterium]
VDYGLACDANTPTPVGTAAVSTPTTLLGFGDAGEMIIPRVDHFTIQLGARSATGNFAYYTINQYRQLAISARATTPPGIPPRIVSVKFAVLVRSLDNTKNAAIDLSKKIDVLNQNVDLTDKTTKYARRVYTTTVALRNALGERI